MTGLVSGGHGHPDRARSIIFPAVAGRLGRQGAYVGRTRADGRYHMQQGRRARATHPLSGREGECVCVTQMALSRVQTAEGASLVWVIPRLG